MGVPGSEGFAVASYGHSFLLSLTSIFIYGGGGGGQLSSHFRELAKPRHDFLPRSP